MNSMLDEVKNLPGLKEDALRALGPCAVCGKKLLEGGQPTFYVVEVAHAAFDQRAVQRRIGLGFATSDQLARVVGPNEDLAKVFTARRAVVHERCALELRHVGQILEDKS